MSKTIQNFFLLLFFGASFLSFPLQAQTIPPKKPPPSSSETTTTAPSSAPQETAKKPPSTQNNHSIEAQRAQLESILQHLLQEQPSPSPNPDKTPPSTKDSQEAQQEALKKLQPLWRSKLQGSSPFQHTPPAPSQGEGLPPSETQNNPKNPIPLESVQPLLIQPLPLLPIGEKSQEVQKSGAVGISTSSQSPGAGLPPGTVASPELPNFQATSKGPSQNSNILSPSSFILSPSSNSSLSKTAQATQRTLQRQDFIVQLTPIWEDPDHGFVALYQQCKDHFLPYLSKLNDFETGKNLKSTNPQNPYYRVENLENRASNLCDKDFNDWYHQGKPPSTLTGVPIPSHSPGESVCLETCASILAPLQELFDEVTTPKPFEDLTTITGDSSYAAIQKKVDGFRQAMAQAVRHLDALIHNASPVPSDAALAALVQTALSHSLSAQEQQALLTQLETGPLCQNNPVTCATLHHLLSQAQEEKNKEQGSENRDQGTNFLKVPPTIQSFLQNLLVLYQAHAPLFQPEILSFLNSLPASFSQQSLPSIDWFKILNTADQALLRKQRDLFIYPNSLDLTSFTNPLVNSLKAHSCVDSVATDGIHLLDPSLQNLFQTSPGGPGSGTQNPSASYADFLKALQPIPEAFTLANQLLPASLETLAPYTLTLYTLSLHAFDALKLWLIQFLTQLSKLSDPATSLSQNLCLFLPINAVYERLSAFTSSSSSTANPDSKNVKDFVLTPDVLAADPALQNAYDTFLSQRPLLQLTSNLPNINCQDKDQYDPSDDRRCTPYQSLLASGKKCSTLSNAETPYNQCMESPHPDCSGLDMTHRYQCIDTDCHKLPRTTLQDLCLQSAEEQCPTDASVYGTCTSCLGTAKNEGQTPCDPTTPGCFCKNAPAPLTTPPNLNPLVSKDLICIQAQWNTTSDSKCTRFVSPEIDCSQLPPTADGSISPDTISCALCQANQAFSGPCFDTTAPGCICLKNGISVGEIADFSTNTTTLRPTIFSLLKNPNLLKDTNNNSILPGLANYPTTYSCHCLPGVRSCNQCYLDPPHFFPLNSVQWTTLSRFALGTIQNEFYQAKAFHDAVLCMDWMNWQKNHPTALGKDYDPSKSFWYTNDSAKNFFIQPLEQILKNYQDFGFCPLNQPFVQTIPSQIDKITSTDKSQSLDSTPLVFPSGDINHPPISQRLFQTDPNTGKFFSILPWETLQKLYADDSPRSCNPSWLHAWENLLKTDPTQLNTFCTQLSNALSSQKF